MFEKFGLQFGSQVRYRSAVVPKEEVAGKVRQIMAAEETDVEVDKIRPNLGNVQKAARQLRKEDPLKQP